MLILMRISGCYRYKKVRKSERICNAYALCDGSFATLFILLIQSKFFLFYLIYFYFLDLGLSLTCPEHSLCQSSTNLHVPDNVTLQFTARKSN